MKTTKHTPGPWNINFEEIDLARIASENEGVCLTNHANAALIAAAPEMYEALEHGISELMRAYKMTSKLEMEDHKFGAPLNETIMRLNEALKAARNKARGEQ